MVLIVKDDDEETVLPFVLTKAHGGEYETEGFGAGWHLGVLDARLTLAELAGLFIPPISLKTKWRRQIDLIAMAHTMVVRVYPDTEEPENSYFSIAPAEFFERFGDKDTE